MAAAATALSIAEYLDTAYRPDCELVDGELLERNVGEYDHSRLQSVLSARMFPQERAWNVRILTEQRLRVSPYRFRIPDVCIVSRDQPIEQVFSWPPLVCIEILSPSDTLASLQDRVDDYMEFGVPNIWVLDPVRHTARVCTPGSMVEPTGRTLSVADTPIHISLDELFADLD